MLLCRRKLKINEMLKLEGVWLTSNGETKEWDNEPNSDTQFHFYPRIIFN